MPADLMGIQVVMFPPLDCWPWQRHWLKNWCYRHPSMSKMMSIAL